MSMLHIDRKYLMLLSPRLEKFKRVREDLYNFRCPYCGDSEKFRNKARGYFYRKKADMFYRCHNCSMGTTFSKVLQWIDADLYREYVLERYKDSVPNTEPEFQFAPPVFKKTDPNLKDLIPINKLNVGHPARQYVANRLIPEGFYSDLFLCHKFSKWAKIQAEEHPRLVIPFRDETGEVVAAQGRAFGKEQPKYLTLKFDESKPKIFGLDRLDLDEIVYVVEGPLDSLFVDNCIAVAGSDFNDIPPCEAVIIMDNEPRNNEVVRTMEKLIEQDYSIVIWPDTITHKDINDCVLAGVDVKTIIENNTHQGLSAMMAIANWKKT